MLLTFFQKLVDFCNDNDLIFEAGYRSQLEILSILRAHQVILKFKFLGIGGHDRSLWTDRRTLPYLIQN